MSAPLLELRDVRVDAGGRTILAVDRLALDAGATTAVIGPNGSGKSTLLRVAGALIAPAAGAVAIDGAPATRAGLRHATAAVLQRPLLRRGTVRSNVETGLRFRGVDRATSHERGQTWLERLGIAALAQRPAHTLSGGEAQRVSLARALAVAPRLLLLDEPFAGLDAPTRGELLADLRDVLAETATAALLVTHDRHEAVALADRLVVLHAGELRQEGPIAAVLDAPADRDCARILGFDTILPAALAARLALHRSRTVAVRAADVAVEEDGAGAGPVARLRRVLPMDGVSRVVVEVDGHRLTATASAPPPAWLAALRPGDPLRVRITPGAVRELPDEEAQSAQSPQRKPVAEGAGASGLAGSPGGGSGSL